MVWIRHHRWFSYRWQIDPGDNLDRNSDKDRRKPVRGETGRDVDPGLIPKPVRLSSIRMFNGRAVKNLRSTAICDMGPGETEQLHAMVIVVLADGW